MAFVLKSQQKARIKETQRSVHWTLGILRHLGAFSWLRVRKTEGTIEDFRDRVDQAVGLAS